MIPMDVLHTIDDLLEVKSCPVLVQPSLHYLIQLSIARQLHNHKDIVGCIQNLVQFNDVGVVDELKDSYLSLHLHRWEEDTLEIIFLFFIFFLLIILTATSNPVKSCLATTLTQCVPLTLANPPVPNVFPNM